MVSQTSHPLRPIPLASSRFTSLFPSQGGHDRSEASLIAGPYAIVGGAAHRPRLSVFVGGRLDLELQRADEHLQQAHPGFADEVIADDRFPRIAFIAGGLFGHGVFKLELAIRPPCATRAIEVNRFGEQLVAILSEAIDVDRSAFEWPETAAARFVAQICFLVGRADEHALPRFDHLQSAVARAIALGGAADETLQQ